MRRQPHQLASRTFDVLVIGGGIYGAWIAYDAALRGLSVAIIDKTDWAAGTSSASSKLIHGGLRYLEHGWLGLVQRSLRERGRLLRLAPHRIQPLEFILPVFDGDRVGRLRLGLGLSLYDLMACGKGHLPRHRSLGKGALATTHSYLDQATLRGGFSFHDAVSDDARYTLEIIAGAITAGAVGVNHVSAEELLQAEGRVQGAMVIDGQSGDRMEVRAKVTVGAMGPWTGLLPGTGSLTGRIRLTKGVHLVMPSLPGRQAMLLTAPGDGRVFFLIPWYGQTLLGTTDTDHHTIPETAVVTQADLDYLLTAVNARCPGLGWERKHVISSFAGVRSMRQQAGESPSSVSREWGLEEPLPGFLVPIGGKLTGARHDAETVVDRICGQGMGIPHGRRCMTRDLDFPWTPPVPWEPWLKEQTETGVALGLREATAAACAHRYGSTVGLLHARLRHHPEQAVPVAPHAPFCIGEVAHAAEFEMATTLIDMVRRRIPLTLLARLDRELIHRLAIIAGGVLAWSPGRLSSEVESVLARSGTGSWTVPATPKAE